MKAYLIRRTLNLIPTLLLVSLIVFAVVRILPGDPVYTLAAVEDGNEIDQVLYDRLVKEYGLDKPIAQQYAEWLFGVLKGDWGSSLFNRMPTFDQIIDRLGFTLQLSILAWVSSILIGVPLGIVAALKRNKVPDVAATTFAMAGVALPNFWLGLLLIIVFGVWLGWVPVGGYTPFNVSPFGYIQTMILPTLTLGTALAATLQRQTRSAMLEVLNEDYVRTARSKGLQPRTVVWRHALKNALIPVVTVSSLQLGTLMGGTVITESVFALPGIGRFIVDSIIEQDYNNFQMGMLVITLGVLIANFVADLIYGFLDPRIRFR